MWICQHCGTDVEESWDTCWNCLWTRDGQPPQQREADAEPAESRSLACLRCQTPLKFLGTKNFREGSGAPGFWLGNVGELLIQHEQFDLFACPRCRHVELFLHEALENAELHE